MTAARYDEVSWAADTEGQYDEYVYHWTSAVYGETPGSASVNTDANGDGAVSMSEAHEYAKNHDSRDEHPQIGSCAATACGASLAAPSSLREDCVSFNPATTAVTSIDGRWKIVDGSHWIFDFGSNRAEAEQSLQIIKKHNFTRTCFVGPSFLPCATPRRRNPRMPGNSRGF
jgi:protocatechuate 3,4-dioxygenase beta subunit